MLDARVVLVRPHYPGNVGAVARVMHNFGLSRLVLVEPVADWRGPEARRLATHGEFILDAAVVASDLRDALADCVTTAATSAKIDGVVRATGSGELRGMTPIIAQSPGPIALVFGPEPSGLTTEEIGYCHYLLHIPTSPEYPALNLAQAVAISLYELSQSPTAPSPATDVATHAELERMFDHLQAALESIHFLYGPKSASLMHAVRHLIGRAAPTTTEVRILHGLARQLEWVVKHASEFPSIPSESENPKNH